MGAEIETADAPSPMTVAGQQLRLIIDGPTRLAHYLATIAGANRAIRLVTYNFVDDVAGRAVLGALLSARARGVDVRLIIDSFGSSTTSAALFAPLIAAGAQLHWFSGRWSNRYLIRNHQKLLVADENVAVVGGFNIADVYFAAADAPAGWRDLGLWIAGDFAGVTARWFDILFDWARRDTRKWRDLTRAIRNFDGGDGAISLRLGGPTARLSPWAQALRRTMQGACSLHISTAYFSPYRSVIRRIGAAGRNGQAQLILPARSDNPATVGASRLLYGYLMKRGVAVYEFTPSLLHNKIIVADDHVFIGSANFDMRSLYINVELMVEVTDAGFAAQCRALVAHQATAKSTQITQQLHASRAGWLNRLRWVASWLIVAVVDYGVARRLNFGLPKRD